MFSDGTAVKQATIADRRRRYRAPVDLANTLKFPLQRPLRMAWNSQTTATRLIFYHPTLSIHDSSSARLTLWQSDGPSF